MRFETSSRTMSSRAQVVHAYCRRHAFDDADACLQIGCSKEQGFSLFAVCIAYELAKPSTPTAGVLMDICADLRTDMCVSIYKCTHMCIDMCTDIRIDMCIDMCVDMCIDMHIDMCMHLLPARPIRRRR